jgi:methionyl aminopeptidase
LINVTKNSLQKGIDQAKVGNHIGDIGFAIQDYVEKAGYSVVRTLVGHGVGRHIHEDPMVPNFGTKGTGPKIVPNMTIAIEPMVSMGDYNVYQDTDGWTFKTDDGSLACHFEHSVYITADKTIILTMP